MESMNNLPNFNFNFINPNLPNQTPAGNSGANLPNINLNPMPLNPTPVNQEIFTPMFQNQAPEQPQPKAPAEEATMFNFEMAKMDNETLLKYLQSALKMPDSIEKFIKSADTKALKVLVENMINTKALGEFLNQNSTNAIEKILKTISETMKSGATDISQLKDILGILTAIQSQTNLNTNAIKELMLLYIPLNPMVFDKQIDFTPASGDIEEKINNSTLSIVFETVNFSNILCCINSIQNGLYVEMYIDKIFPYERFTKIINTVAKEINFRVEIEPKYSRKINSSEPKIARNFKVFSAGFVPIDVLLLASIIIKTVFKADEMYNNEEG